MEQLYTAIATAAGGLTIPFIVGYFVHAGASVGGYRVPWALESRLRLIAESSYYFVALLVATAAAAGLVFKLPTVAPIWIFLIHGGAAVASCAAFLLSLHLRDVETGQLKLCRTVIPDWVGEFVALGLIWFPVLGWTYVARIVMDKWDLGRNAESEPLRMSLPLVLLLLTPLALWTFSFTAQTWGLLFAHHRYRYPQATVSLKNQATVRGQLVHESEHDVRVLVDGTLTVISRDQVAGVEITVA